ncbi:MAG: hypothetical protein MI810_09190 [Flavobacteriales bacterium]|nr:hypothetical protein [Flavobacteriales bacterium]
MKKKEFRYIEEPTYKINCKEVIKELNGQSHLLCRLSITATGDSFIQRAMEGVIRIMYSKEDYVYSWFAEISHDGRTLHGYFPIDTKVSDWIEYGYGETIFRVIRLKANPENAMLDKSRLSKELIRVTDDYIAKVDG